MTLPILVSYLHNTPDFIPLVQSFAITFCIGGSLFFFTKKNEKEDIRHREAFLIVTLTWLIMSFCGSLPFILSGTFDSFTDAYFESMSGFTTTGASVLTDIEVVPHGILFWRGMTHWVGGMGIIVFALAILPFLGTGGMQLFKAEVPEISLDKLRPRIVDTAKALWLIYLTFTAANAALLYVAGMNLFDALCHAFATIATGGFSTKNASIAAYQSPAIEFITSFFMFMAGVNYSLYFYFFRGYHT
jgi:trk system potassium uptake protein TrkH